MTIWLSILTGAMGATFVTIVAHHMWEARRENGAIERHATVLKLLADQRGLTLAAIKQRTDLEAAVANHEARIKALETRCGDDLR